MDKKTLDQKRKELLEFTDDFNDKDIKDLDDNEFKLFLKRKQKEYKRINLIESFSYVSLGLGIILIILVIILIFLKDFKGNDLSNLYIIIGILFLFGFIGSDFISIVKSTIKQKLGEKIKEYIENNKLEFEENLKKQIEKKLEDKVIDEVINNIENKNDPIIDDIDLTINTKNETDLTKEKIIDKITKTISGFQTKQNISHLGFWKGKTKFLELYTKNNIVTFRLRHKNNNLFTTDNVSSNGDFKSLNNEYWDTIFRDYKFDINNTNDLEKGLKYLKECFDGYKNQ